MTNYIQHLEKRYNQQNGFLLFNRTKSDLKLCDQNVDSIMYTPMSELNKQPHALLGKLIALDLSHTINDDERLKQIPMYIKRIKLTLIIATNTILIFG